MMLNEKRSMAWRSGASSSTISRKSPPIGAGPTTRITSLSLDRQRVEGIEDGAVPRHVAHVDVVVDHRRHFGDGEQPALRAHLHRHGAGADAAEDLPRQAFGHHAARRRVQHQRRGVGGGEPVVQPVEPEVRDRRHIDQHFRDHHEQDREDEELAGQTEPRRRPARPVFGSSAGAMSGAVFCVMAVSRSQPNQRSRFKMRRTQLVVKRGVKKVMAARFPISV